MTTNPEPRAMTAEEAAHDAKRREKERTGSDVGAKTFASMHMSWNDSPSGPQDFRSQTVVSVDDLMCEAYVYLNGSFSYFVPTANKRFWESARLDTLPDAYAEWMSEAEDDEVDQP